MRARVGNLPAGRWFRTLGTRRRGVVRDLAEVEGEFHTRVLLLEPYEDDVVLHRDVVVDALDELDEGVTWTA